MDEVRQAEADIQEAIVTWLHLAYPQALVFQFAQSRSRPRCPACGKVVGPLAGGVPVGWPDLLVIICDTTPELAANWRRSYFHFEVKTAGGKVRPDQFKTIASLRDIGAEACVVRSVNEVREILVGAGFEPVGGL